MKRAYLLVFLGLGLTLGCATILGGSNQTVTVNSNVSGAEVHLNDRLLGVTPLTTSLKRGQEGVLRVTAPGYQPYQIAMNKKISTLFWVNILSGGAFGSTTDYATGAMYEYEPSTYMVSLQPAGRASAPGDAWRRKEGLRAFVLLNNEALVSDLADGEGEHVDVLVKILGISTDSRASAIERWRSGYAASATALEFAQLIVDEVR